jgi:hypothetical protein
MKIIITERQKDLLFENKRNELLINMIKNEGWESAAEMVGGVENLKRVIGIETPMDFLNLFNDLDIVQSEKHPDWILFRYVRNNNILIYDEKNRAVYINYDFIWSFLKNGFGLKYSEIQEISKEWLSEVYDLREITTEFTMIEIILSLS